jgi:hypothetical protein
VLRGFVAALTFSFQQVKFHHSCCQIQLFLEVQTAHTHVFIEIFVSIKYSQQYPAGLHSEQKNASILPRIWQDD